MLDALSDRKRSVTRGPAESVPQVTNGFRDGDSSQVDDVH